MATGQEGVFAAAIELAVRAVLAGLGLRFRQPTSVPADSAWRCVANASWYWLLMHVVRRPVSRARSTAGRSSPMSVATIAITTISSISVKPPRGERSFMAGPPRRDW
jgi:hypothetical protein